MIQATLSLLSVLCKNRFRVAMRYAFSALLKVLLNAEGRRRSEEADAIAGSVGPKCTNLGEPDVCRRSRYDL